MQNKWCFLLHYVESTILSCGKKNSDFMDENENFYQVQICHLHFKTLSLLSYTCPLPITSKTENSIHGRVLTGNGYLITRKYG